MYIEKIIDVSTGEEIIRDYDSNEIKEVEAARKQAAAISANLEEIAEKKKLILEKLGITEEEAKLLLS